MIICWSVNVVQIRDPGTYALPVTILLMVAQSCRIVVVVVVDDDDDANGNFVRHRSFVCLLRKCQLICKYVQCTWTIRRVPYAIRCTMSNGMQQCMRQQRQRVRQRQQETIFGKLCAQRQIASFSFAFTVINEPFVCYAFLSFL